MGIDEVGRGPLAGPITVGAVAAPANSKFEIQSLRLRALLKGIKDSKQLSAELRENWNSRIRNDEPGITNFNIAVASVSPQFIDKVGISAAAKLAVRRCLKKLSASWRIENCGLKILLDGSLYAPSSYGNQKTIIKGDEKVPIIAAASIIAKVARDKKMKKLHKKFPLYGFNEHKGYGTSLHRRAIIKYGLCGIHRRSFCRKFAGSAVEC